MITPEEKQQIFQDIWRGVITEFSPPVILFRDTWDDLQKGLFRGFGGNLTDFTEGSREFKILTEFNTNLNKFSAAKTFQNIKDTKNFVLDSSGNLRPFTEFRKDANKIFKIFNENWLKVEFETTVANAQTAIQWKDIQSEKKIFPLLKYQTAGDQRVRPEHAAWDGIVKPVDDSFWDTRMPQNAFGCRCVVIQLEEGEEEITNLGNHLKKVKKETGVTTLDNTVPLFSVNPGKQKVIFAEKGRKAHPYFKVDNTFKILKSNNFNLPLG